MARHSYDLPSSIIGPGRKKSKSCAGSVQGRERERERERRKSLEEDRDKGSLRYARLTLLRPSSSSLKPLSLSLSLPVSLAQTSFARPSRRVTSITADSIACFATTIHLCIRMHTNNTGQLGRVSQELPKRSVGGRRRVGSNDVFLSCAEKNARGITVGTGTARGTRRRTRACVRNNYPDSRRPLLPRKSLTSYWER